MPDQHQQIGQSTGNAQKMEISCNRAEFHESLVSAWAGNEGERINRRIQREILSIYREELAELQKEGVSPDRNLAVLTFNVLGVINWQLRWYQPNGNLSFEEVSQEIISFILYGLLGGPAESDRLAARVLSKKHQT